MGNVYTTCKKKKKKKKKSKKKKINKKKKKYKKKKKKSSLNIHIQQIWMHMASKLDTLFFLQMDLIKT